MNKIPESAIIEWRDTVPWLEDSQVEQDLIICRALQDDRLKADNVMICFLKYMENEGKQPAHSLYTSNMEDKLNNAEFLGDTNNLLRPNMVYNPLTSYEVVKEKLIDKLLNISTQDI
jgi:hypothetical protein